MTSSILVDLAALLLVFSLTMYVILDGFDLGVGILLAVGHTQEERDQMIEAVEPVWDGNETWLIMTALALWAAFPIAYGTLLPAFYVPLIGMLMCLGLRGVSFEFRESAHTRTGWDAAFWVGSAGAAFLQGTVLGGLMSGVHVAMTLEGGVTRYAFFGGPLDFLSWSSCLCGVLTVAGYSVLGSAWLRGKMDGALWHRGATHHRIAVVAFAVMLVAAVACCAIGNVALREAFLQRSGGVLASLALAAGAILISLRGSGQGARDWSYTWSAVAVVFVFGGIACLLWPQIVPFAITFEQASAPASSILFVLIGAAVVVPVILAYTGMAYWIFRGRVDVHEAVQS